MTVVSATQVMGSSVHEAETLWYDTSRWSAWVDGLDRVVSVTGRWPEAGAAVVWDSGPAGRGRVTERVTGHVPLEGQSLSVDDYSITGKQSITFAPTDGGVDVELRLDYRITSRSIFTPIVDALFVRGAMRRSLRATLSRFGYELEAATGRRGAG